MCRQRHSALRTVAAFVGAVAVALGGSPVSAELALLTNGDFLKIESYRLVGADEMRLDLAQGGSLFLPVVRIERIVDDEIVVEEAPPLEPEEAPLPMLRWSDGHSTPEAPYGDLFLEAGRRHQLNPLLLSAMARAESAYDPSALSVKGARGLLQLMPATAERFGVRPADLYDPQRNVEAASRYLNFLIGEFDGELELVLAAYNAGEGNVRRYDGVPPFRETRTYIQRIFRFLGLDS